MEPFIEMLTGGHPNSLGRTLEVVDEVLAHENRLDELYNCYFSSDEVIRLRTSNALKRIAREKRELLAPYLDGLLTDIAEIDQASTQWTLATLFDLLKDFMSADQRTRAKGVMMRNLEHHTDWIVLNTTVQVLGGWALDDPHLKKWIGPHLERLSGDPRKSVAKTAQKVRASIESDG